MARLAIWIGNVRNRTTGIVQDETGARVTTAVELDEGVNNITHAFPIYISANTSNNETSFDLKVTEATTATILDRATADAAGYGAVTLVATDDDPVRGAMDLTSLATAMAEMTTLDFVEQAGKGDYRWTFGKGIYAMGYAWVTSGTASISLAQANDISNVHWK